MCKVDLPKAIESPRRGCCSINASPNEFLVCTPPTHTPLETHLFEVLREVEGGDGGGSKKEPPFLGLKIMNLLVVFDFEPKKCFQVPNPWGLYGAGWDERLMQFMHFSAIFAILAVLATSVTPWYPL